MFELQLIKSTHFALSTYSLNCKYRTEESNPISTLDSTIEMSSFEDSHFKLFHKL